MAAQGAVFDVVPSDQVIGTALRLAQLWRRLAEFRTWAPLKDATAVREALKPLAWGGTLNDADIDDWLGGLNGRGQIPALIRAGRGGAGLDEPAYGISRSVDARRAVSGRLRVAPGRIWTGYRPALLGRSVGASSPSGAARRRRLDGGFS